MPGSAPLFADLTFGAGGHSLAILDAIAGSKVLAVDCDPASLAYGRKLIEDRDIGHRIGLLAGNFARFPDLRSDFTLDKERLFEGILMDLGVSSHHFDDPMRGFSFKNDGSLDMRMKGEMEGGVTAFSVVNDYPPSEIERVLFEYGEERYAKRIVRKIVERRSLKSIGSTWELADIVRGCYPKSARYGRIDPATRSFQALRIEVNDELNVLSKTLDRVVPFLKIGGRLLVVSFHSLEDRIVKHRFRDFQQRDDMTLVVVTKKPIVPSESEILHNSRARSAKLRIIERIASEIFDKKTFSSS